MKSYISKLKTTIPALGVLRLSIAIVFCISIFSTLALAVPPAHDKFVNAQLLSGVSGEITTFNISATKEAGEPAHGRNRGGASVWFKYVAPGNGVLTVTAYGDANPVIGVYRGPSVSTLTLIAENDDTVTEFGFTQASKLYLGTAAGATYYIAVDGTYNTNIGGAETGEITLGYDFSNAAQNDNFFSANNSDYATLARKGETISLTATNVGTSKEALEPDHAGNAGGRSIWFRFRAADVPAHSVTLTLESRSVVSPSQGIGALFAVYSGLGPGLLIPVTNTYAAPGTVARLTFLVNPNTNYYVAVDGNDAGNGAEIGNFRMSYGRTQSQKSPDFDRDNKADHAVYRPSTGTFYSLQASTGTYRSYQWGANGDKPMLNHAEADGNPDFYVFRPDTKTWYLSGSSSGISVFNWGLGTDIPKTINQYEAGQSRAYPVVFRPSTGDWWIYRSGQAPINFKFGQNFDIPMTADFTGDGTDEIAVFRPSTGTWYMANPFTGVFIGAVVFGIAGDIVVPADYDKDGIADIAVYRPSTGTWWVRDRHDGTAKATQFGISTDKPQPADYDNDGGADFAVFRPSTGQWWIMSSFNTAVTVVQFGSNGDIPVTAPIF